MKISYMDNIMNLHATRSMYCLYMSSAKIIVSTTMVADNDYK